MQGKIQNKIQQLMADHKRRRMWKRATAMLSAVVLLSTFLSLRDFAIAVTEENAREAQISERLMQTLAETAEAQTAGTDDLDATGLVRFTPDEAPAAVAATPAAVDVAAQPSEEVSSAPAAVDVAVQQPEEASSAPATVEAAPAAVEVTAQQPEEVSSAPTAVDEAPVTIDDTLTPLAPEAVEGTEDLALEGEALNAAPMRAPAATPQAAKRITSAEPMTRGLVVLDGNGKAAGTVRVDDELTVTIGWRIANATEVTDAGDYFDIDLPEELDFSAHKSGAYTLEVDTTTVTGVVLPAGTDLATYTISGNTVRVTFTAEGVIATASGLVNTPALKDGIEWSAMRFNNVRFKNAGQYTPKMTIRGSGKSTENYYGRITVLDNKIDRLTNLTITSVTLPNAASWRPANSLPYRPSVDENQRFELKIDWVGSGTHVISSGDYFEILLPDRLEYLRYKRAEYDKNGNLIVTEVNKNDYDKWVLRVTFEDVHGFFNLIESGTETIVAIPLSYLISNHRVGREELKYGDVTLTATLSGSNSSASTQIYVRPDDTSSGGGNGGYGYWYIQRGNTVDSSGRPVTGVYQIWDYIADTVYRVPESQFDYYIEKPGSQSSSDQTVAKLYVMADQENKPNLSPYPFDLQFVSNYNTSLNKDRRVDFVPGASNYIDVYCGDRSNLSDPGGRYIRYTLARDTSFTAGFSQDGTSNVLSANRVNKLHNILSASYPYVSLETMGQKLGITITDKAAAVSAVQTALWNVLHQQTWRVKGNKAATANAILTQLENYTPGTAYNKSYSFTKGPEISYVENANGTLSAVVTGTIGSTPIQSDLKGTFSNNTGKRVDITINRNNGTFTARLDDISYDDKFFVNFKWSTSSDVTVYYYKGSDKGLQNCIAAEIEEGEEELDWEYQGRSREIKVIKRWYDEDGNLMTTWPEGLTIEAKLVRWITGGAREDAPVTPNPVILSATNPTYVWTGLPTKDAAGNTYHYEVVETALNGQGYTYAGSETTVEGDTAVFVLKNRKEKPETTEVTIIKEWSGIPESKKGEFKAVVGLYFRILNDRNRNDNHGLGWKNPVLIRNGSPVTAKEITGEYRIDIDNVPPDYTGGYVDAIAELTQANNWRVTFTDLPKFDDNGDEIQYLVRELRVEQNGEDVTEDFVTSYVPGLPDYPFGDGNYYCFVDKNDKTVKITNAKTENSLIVIKEWKERALDGSLRDATENLPEYIKAVLSITKEDGTPIPANMWDLYVQGGYEVREAILAKENGYKHTWSIYPTKGIVFKVTEVEVPEGWANEEDTVTAVLENGVWVVRLVNIREKTKVRVIKIDGDREARHLEGAEFRLYTSDAPDTALNLKEVVPGKIYTTDANGEIWLEDLQLYQTYVLVETKAPAGYVPVDPNNPPMVIFKVIVNATGAHELKILNVSTNAVGGADYYQKDPLTMTICIRNELISYTLPESGGIGTNRYMTGGVLLMGMAFLLYINGQFMYKKKEGGRKNT